MVSRQQVAIYIVKVNRIARTLEYWIDLNTDIFVPVLRDDILMLGSMVKDIYDYISLNQCETLYKLISAIPDTYNINTFLISKRKSLPDEIVVALESYITLLDNLFAYIDSMQELVYGGDYSLPVELNTEQGKALLHLLIQEGYITRNFKARPRMKLFQARLLAYAIIQQLSLKRGAWSVLTRLWYSDDVRISNCYIPAISTKEVQDIVELFPTVDFGPCWDDSRNLIFNCDKSKEDKQILFKALKKNSFIENKTTYKQFAAIFGDSKLTRKINWIGTQLELVYLINLVFHNTHNLLNFRICNCFYVNGLQPNKGSLRSNFRHIVNKGLLETYNPLLYSIAKSFNKTDLYTG